MVALGTRLTVAITRVDTKKTTGVSKTIRIVRDRVKEAERFNLCDIIMRRVGALKETLVRGSDLVIGIVKYPRGTDCEW
jgi:hypothetical protein